MKLPEVSKALLDHLDKRFPDKAPREDVGSFEFGRAAGRQEILDILRLAFNKQQETEHV